MIRKLTAFLLFVLAVPALLSAQRAVMVAPNTSVVAWIPASMLQGTTKSWRDSVQEAWATHLTPAAEALSPAPIPGSMGEVHLQILRDGRLHRVWLARSTGSQEIDTRLVDAARAAARDSAYPAMPASEDGAGVEAIMRVYLPIPANGRSSGPRPALPSTLADYSAPVPSGECSTRLATPNEWTPMVLLASVDTVTGDTNASGWGMRTLTSLPEAFTPVTHAAPSVRPDIMTGPIGQHPLSGSLRLSITATGKVGAAELIGSTGYPAIDSALLAMAKRADSLGVIPPPAAGSAPAVIELRFALGARAPAGWSVIGGVEIGEWLVDATPTLRRIGPVHYPENLHDRNVSGRVVVDFVIGPDGKTVPTSLVVRQSSAPEFSAASVNTIRGTEFTPAKIGGCPVAMWASQAINFAPERPLVRRDVVTTRPIMP